jgi:hypothetical protein
MKILMAAVVAYALNHPVMMISISHSHDSTIDFPLATNN